MSYRHFFPITFMFATQFCLGGVSIQFEFESLRDKNGGPVESGTLWALISVDPNASLPGALSQDSSMTSASVPMARTDFGGATIEKGSSVGGGFIIATGQTKSGGLMTSFIKLTDEDYQNIESGDLIGLYWFPGIIEETTVLPDSGFSIGGIHETMSGSDLDDNAGMVVPANSGSTITIGYFDIETTGNPDSLPVDRFTAIEVPPSGYQVWRDDLFTPSQIEAGDGDPDSDPDGDGLANLLEYATGSNPLAPGPSPLVLTRSGESVVLEFNQIADPELRYRIEATEDLGITPWPDVVFDSSGVENVDGLIEISRPFQPGRWFFRLRVEFVDGAGF